MTEALDQFAERVLGELRTNSERTGTELGTLRSELTVARESDRRPQREASSRQVREAVDELRGDVSGLRRAVLEWPDLEQLRRQALVLRADVTALLEGPVGSGDVAEIRFEAVLQELGSLREQLLGVFEPDAEEDDKFASFVEDLQVVRVRRRGTAGSGRGPGRAANPARSGALTGHGPAPFRSDLTAVRFRPVPGRPRARRGRDPRRRRCAARAAPPARSWCRARSAARARS